MDTLFNIGIMDSHHKRNLGKGIAKEEGEQDRIR
jgi:hypothetical protein